MLFKNIIFTIKWLSLKTKFVDNVGVCIPFIKKKESVYNNIIRKHTILVFVFW